MSLGTIFLRYPWSANMLSNPFSRPTRTIFLFVVFLLAGILYYRLVHEIPHGFPHLDTESLHSYLNRSERAQKPLALMSKWQKHLQFSECVPEVQVVNSIQHHYRTETKTKTISATMTTTAIIKPTCEGNIGGPISSKEDATLEQRTVAKLRDQGIIIIFKTGAQEVSHLAIQVGTTLRYLSSNDILFFSDQQGSIGPFLINDALRNVNQSLKNDHLDFEIYRKIKEYQSTGQDIEELQEDKTKGTSRSGWKLDKYKFMHMVEESFEMRPDAKWYVFIETDSYVFWDNLAEWLKRFDSTKPWYIGSMVQHDGVQFAHGGSGYILSNAAMNKLLGPDQPQGLAASWDARMKDTPYGDKAVGMALNEKEIKLSVAHPVMNGYKPSTFTYGPKNHWCQPVVTMHHIMPHEVSNVWRYERQRELMGMANHTLFADLYLHFVEPHLVDSRDNWDNLSHGPTFSQEKVDIENKQRKAAEAAEKKAAEEKQKKEKDVADKKKEDKEENEKADELKEQKDGGGDTTVGSDTKAATETKANDGGGDDHETKSTSSPKVENNDQKQRIESGKPSEETLKTKPNMKEDEGKQDVKKPATSMGNVEKEQEESKDTNTEEDTEKGADDEDGSKKKETEGKATSKKKVGEETSEADKTGPTTKMNDMDARSSSSKNSRLTKRGEDQKITDAQSHAHESFEKCGNLCKELSDCFQWVYYSKTCKLGMSFRLGQYVKPSDDGKVTWKSGWLVSRVRKWTDENACTKPEWLEL